MRKCVKNFNLGIGIMPKSRLGHILFVSMLIVTAMHLCKQCHFWDSGVLFCLLKKILFPGQKKKSIKFFIQISMSQILKSAEQLMNS